MKAWTWHSGQGRCPDQGGSPERFSEEPYPCSRNSSWGDSPGCQGHSNSVADLGPDRASDHPQLPPSFPGVQWSCRAPAHHPERVGHCPGPGQHSGERYGERVGSPGRAPRYGERGWEVQAEPPRMERVVGRSRPSPRYGERGGKVQAEPPGRRAQW